MIREFTVKNFYSFKEENTVRFLVNQKAPHSDAYVDTKSDERLSKVLAIFGANASGKTNLLKALIFLRWFMTDSFALKPDGKIPLQPFRFEDGNTKPVNLSVTFECENDIYRYNILLSPERVCDESLFVRGDNGFHYLFKRFWNTKTGKYDFKAKRFGRTKAFGETIQLRQNASVLSIARQYNHSFSMKILECWTLLNTNVEEYGREGMFEEDSPFVKILESAEFYQRHPGHMEKAQNLLTRFDLGLSGIEIIEREIVVGKEEKTTKLFAPYGIHIGRDESVHKLPFFYESNGTQNLFILLKQILPVLETGGIAVLDEFEVDLHPHMIPPLVDLFVSKTTNPHNAQLFFSCHSHEIMKRLDKYQIVLVEKDEYGYSQVIRLDELKGVRADDNLYAKYDSGAYGAVPNL